MQRTAAFDQPCPGTEMLSTGITNRAKKINLEPQGYRVRLPCRTEILSPSPLHHRGSCAVLRTPLPACVLLGRMGATHWRPLPGRAWQPCKPWRPWLDRC